MKRLDWKDFDCVHAYAVSLQSVTDLLIYWNGENYNITHGDRREMLEAKGYAITSTVKPREGQ